MYKYNMPEWTRKCSDSNERLHTKDDNKARNNSTQLHLTSSRRQALQSWRNEPPCAPQPSV